MFSQKMSKNELLQTLDSLVEHKEQITLHKEGKIRDLKNLLVYTTSDEQKFRVYAEIFDMYRTFSMDSAEVYAMKKMVLAKKMGIKKYQDDATMNLAEVYGIEGMYWEAISALNSIDKTHLADYIKPNYYHLYQTVYGLMSDYSLMNADRQKNRRLSDVYRDSLLPVLQKNTYVYAMVQSDSLIQTGMAQKAKSILLNWIHQKKNDDNAIRTLAYTLAMAYKQSKDTDNEEYYLIMSVISDLRLSSKEYSSLMDLSKILYEKGDLERAYNYLKCSMEDATYCNARFRTIEVSEIFPIVEHAYQMIFCRKLLYVII